MGLLSKISGTGKNLWRAARNLGRGIKSAAKFSIDSFVIKPVGLLSSWIPVSKKLRLQVFVLRNEMEASLLNTSETILLQNALNYAITTFKDKFDIDIIAYGNPIIQTLRGPAPTSALDAGCAGIGAITDQLDRAGAYFERNSAGWNIIPVSLAFPISVFVVRKIDGKIGCSLGAASDYVTISTEPATPTSTLTGISSLSTLAHELAHCCGLFHSKSRSNIMYPDDSINNPRGNDVTYLQKTVVRSCRHVSFL